VNSGAGRPVGLTHSRDGCFDDLCIIGDQCSSTRRLSAFTALFVFALGVSGCSKLKARDLLNKVSPLQRSPVDTAIEDFKQAKDLDPS